MTSANKKGSSGEVVFNIFRDVGEGNFLNRICKDEGTDVSPTGRRKADLWRRRSNTLAK